MQRLLVAEGLGSDRAIEVDADGKPRLAVGPDRKDPPDISISHSAGMAAAVVSHVGPVGIDIEAHRATRNWRGIAETYFGPRECAVAMSEGVSAFYRIWTLREAMGKATGEGLLTDRTDRVGSLVPADQGTWISEDRQWLLTHLVPRQGLSLAIAVQPQGNLDLGCWSLASIRWPLG